MTVRRYVLPGGEVTSEAAFYAALRRAIPDLPPAFGENLDALWDALTRDLAGPLELVWADAGRSAAALGPRYDDLARLLERAAAEREDLAVRIER